MSEKKAYVTYGNCACGCDGAKEITGCRFSLYPMSDQFVDIILESIKNVDTSKVWQMTDSLSTVCRGKSVHVLDTVKACFVRSYRPGVHMVMEATLSKGCPGDVEADAFLAEDDIPVNEPLIQSVHFPVCCKISLYPMGVADYMSEIAKVVNLAVDRGLYARSSHYITVLEGDVQELFRYFAEVAEICGKEISHYILEMTLSVNSPTPKSANAI